MTSYGGELHYTVRFSPSPPALPILGQPDVVLQGNGIFLEHRSETRPVPNVPQSVSVTFREVRPLLRPPSSVPLLRCGGTLTRLLRPQASWRRADGQACTREHLLMALADISVFMIRATYMDNMAESR